MTTTQCTNFANKTITVTNQNTCGYIGNTQVGCDYPYFCSNGTCKLESELGESDQIDSAHMCKRSIAELTSSGSVTNDEVMQYMMTIINKNNPSVTTTNSTGIVNASFTTQSSSANCKALCNNKDNCYALYNEDLRKCVISDDRSISDLLVSGKCVWTEPCTTYTFTACLKDDERRRINTILSENGISAIFRETQEEDKDK